MSIHPLDPEVYARIKADFRARRGPFRHAVVAPHELLAHYDVRNIKITQCRLALRLLGTVEKLYFVKTQPRSRFFVVDTSLDLTAPEARDRYLRERGIA